MCMQENALYCGLRSFVMLNSYIGRLYMCKLLLWTDAKFSGGHEKSYAKVALFCPELFTLHRSNMCRFVDILGHETAFLSVAGLILVCVYVHVCMCCHQKKLC